MSEKREELNQQVERLRKTREKLGLNRTEFSEYMGIPLRSLEEWEAGRRKMPDYLLRLISYYVGINKYFEDRGMDQDEINDLIDGN